MSKHKKCSPEFKQDAVELTRMESVNISQIAKDSGMSVNMLSRWPHEQERHGANAFQGKGKARDEEMALLTRELVVTL